MLNNQEIEQLTKFWNVIKGEEKYGLQHLYIKGKGKNVIEHNYTDNDTRFGLDMTVLYDVSTDTYSTIKNSDKTVITTDLNADTIISANQKIENVLKRMNESQITAETNVFFTPNLFFNAFVQKKQLNSKEIHNATARRKKNVSKFTTLFVDIDKVSEEEYLNRMSKSNLPRPTFSVKSGNGVHVYWVFAVNVNKKGNEESYIALQKYFTNALNADKQICSDTSRLLRLPFTLNLKDKNNPIKTSFIEFNEENLFDFKTLVDTYIPILDLNEEQSTTNTVVSTKKQTVNTKSTNHVITKKTRRHNTYNQEMLNDIYRLLTIRKSKGEEFIGYRHTILLIVKSFAKNKAEKQVRRFNNDFFNNQISDDEINNILNATIQNYKRSTVYELLNVTKDEERSMKYLVSEENANCIKEINSKIKEINSNYKKILNDYNKYLKIAIAKSKKNEDTVAKMLNVSKKWVKKLKEEKLTDKTEMINRMISTTADMLNTITLFAKNEQVQANKETYAKLKKLEESISTLKDLLEDNSEYKTATTFRISILEKKYEEVATLMFCKVA